MQKHALYTVLSLAVVRTEPGVVEGGGLGLAGVVAARVDFDQPVRVPASASGVRCTATGRKGGVYTANIVGYTHAYSALALSSAGQWWATHISRSKATPSNCLAR